MSALRRYTAAGKAGRRARPLPHGKNLSEVSRNWNKG